MKVISSRVAILQLGLNIFDFVMDVLFASKKAPEIEWLYIPNIIILVLSLTINFTLALYIIYNEKHLKEWLNSNVHLTAVIIFTLLASADITALNILQTDFDVFRAEFSKAARNKIVLGACLNIFVEDLPQIIILALYIRTVGYHDIIPLLALVSSCLTLVMHMIGGLYQIVRRDKRDGRTIVPSIVPSSNDGSTGEGMAQKQPQKQRHQLQFTPPGHDENREIDQGKIGGDGGKVKIVPDVIVDPNIEEAKLNKRGSRGSFQEMI